MVGWTSYKGFKAEGTESRDQFGRYFNHPTVRQLIDFYRQSAPWEILATEEFVGGGYGRSEGPWVAITVQKPS